MLHRPTFTLRIAGRPAKLGERTFVMGVLNVTPDSFSDGGLYRDPKSAVEHGLAMIREGADWIDVGGESTRPGADPVADAEEMARVLPVIQELHRRAPRVPISIDTTKSAVAERALRAGASIVNDISGLRVDPELGSVAKSAGAPLILMHLRGRPQNMQRRPFARSIWRSLGRGLAWSVERATALGVERSQLVLDPGLGFGKSRRQNYEILAGLRRLQRFRLPVLVGSSRKSFVQAVAAGEPLDLPARARTRRTRSAAERWLLTAAGTGAAKQTLESGDAAAVVAAILAGAHVVRVHDVAAILPAVRVADALLDAGGSDVR